MSNNQEWGSHLPSLLAALLATDGPILEVGAGLWSTPMLTAFSVASGRHFLSLEEDPLWAHRTGSEKAIYDRDLPSLAQQRWSVVFLDHSPGPRRAEDAFLFRETAEIIVMHDYADDIEAAFRATLKHWPDFDIYWRFDLADRFLPRTLTLKHRSVML